LPPSRRRLSLAPIEHPPEARSGGGFWEPFHTQFSAKTEDGPLELGPRHALAFVTREARETRHMSAITIRPHWQAARRNTAQAADRYRHEARQRDRQGNGIVLVVGTLGVIVAFALITRCSSPGVQRNIESPRMANAAPEYPRTIRRSNVSAAGDGVLETTTEARQGVTGHNARYVLLFSLGAWFSPSRLIYAVFWA